jgi:hypothetical protein
MISDISRVEKAKILKEKYERLQKRRKIGCVIITPTQILEKDLNPKIRSAVLNKKQSSKLYTLPNEQVNGE